MSFGGIDVAHSTVPFRAHLQRVDRHLMPQRRLARHGGTAPILDTSRTGPHFHDPNLAVLNPSDLSPGSMICATLVRRSHLTYRNQ